MSDADDQPLATFAMPDASAISEVRRVLEQMPAGPCPTGAVFGFDLGSPSLRGDIDQVVDRLRTLLDADYSVNLKECHEWSGGFEYQLDDVRSFDGKSVSGTLVSTRMFGPGGQGGVCYASLLLRVAESEYLLFDGHSDADDPESRSRWLVVGTLILFLVLIVLVVALLKVA